MLQEFSVAAKGQSPPATYSPFATVEVLTRPPTGRGNADDDGDDGVAARSYLGKAPPAQRSAGAGRAPYSGTTTASLRAAKVTADESNNAAAKCEGARRNGDDCASTAGGRLRLPPSAELPPTLPLRSPNSQRRPMFASGRLLLSPKGAAVVGGDVAGAGVGTVTAVASTSIPICSFASPRQQPCKSITGNNGDNRSSVDCGWGGNQEEQAAVCGGLWAACGGEADPKMVSGFQRWVGW